MIVFNQIKNHYNKAAFHPLCLEFNLDQNPDFRWRGGRNHGLGDVFDDEGCNVHVDRPYDIGANTWPDKLNLFSDESFFGTVGNGKLIGFIRNDDHKGKQYEWFIPEKGKGLTKAGLERLNRSVEAFIYCIVGAQVNVRSSIVGNGGGAQETQQEMLKLFEDAVIEEDISQSVQRYQLAVQETKMRLNIAVAPGIWLMPSRLVINTESVEGYNNYLLKA